MRYLIAVLGLALLLGACGASTGVPAPTTSKPSASVSACKAFVAAKKTGNAAQIKAAVALLADDSSNDTAQALAKDWLKEDDPQLRGVDEEAILVACGVPAPAPSASGTTCATVREAFLTGTSAEQTAALNALIKDKSADSTAREYAQKYLAEKDATARGMDKDLIMMACSIP